jgi:glycosyltransferase involved in cell wall biosynthesis
LFHGKKIVVVMPAYNAARTIEQTYREIPLDLVDEVLVTDDASSDETVEISRSLGLHTIVHDYNRGYGGNQKTCYAEALRMGADVVVMLHPDYQYTPALIPAMIGMITDGPFDVVIGSRVLGGRALSGGMPLYKYVSNRFLTAVENLLLGAKLSEYHTGYRAFARHVLEALPLLENSDDFVFDNQMLAQILHEGFSIGEVS